MEWFYPKRRGPEWKYGWKGQTLASISTPPFPLLAIFAIVIFLLSLSQYKNYKTQMQSTMITFQLFLLLSPILLVFVVLLGLTSGGFSLRTLRPHDHRDPSGGGGGSPWAVAILVLVLLVLVSYQSSFHLKWFGSV